MCKDLQFLSGAKIVFMFVHVYIINFFYQQKKAKKKKISPLFLFPSLSPLYSVITMIPLYSYFDKIFIFQ